MTDLATFWSYLSEGPLLWLTLTLAAYLAGDAAYRAALSREATEYELNRISPQQAADLWNDLGRPAPGGGLWNAAKVQALLLLKTD